jgi:hypothetical protein
LLYRVRSAGGIAEYQLVALTDYEDAFRRVTGETINALMNANDPVPEMFPMEPREHIDVLRHTVPSGEVVGSDRSRSRGHEPPDSSASGVHSTGAVE